MPSLSKDVELAALHALIAKLGPDSYCAPWLAEQMPQIAAALRSDLFPGVRARTLAEAEAEARRIVSNAEAEARRIVSNAYAATLKQQADDDYTQRTRNDLREHLRRILGTL